MSKKEILGLVLLSLASIVPGTMYALFNTDPHHWGFIAGAALDSISGKHFFTETYIQYGVGQSLFFKFLSYFLPINYTSLGIITSVVYALNLIFIYLSIKKISNVSVAALFTLTAFLLHSFSIYPWPDYYAGLCLSVACFGWVTNDEPQRLWSSIWTGIFLFFAFLFRNTYLLSFSATIASYFFLCIYFSSLRSRRLTLSLGVFLLLIVSYLGLLTAEGRLSLWYAETIGAGSSQYGIGFRSILALLERAFLLNGLINAVVTLFLYGTIFTGFLVVFNPKRFRFLKVKEPGLLVLLAFFGLFGILQATLGYELFRIQNACSPLFLVCAFYVGEKFSGISFKEIPFQLKAITLILLVSLCMKFPHGSTLWPIYDGKLSAYEKTDIGYYKGHRFRGQERDYYQGLVKLLCAQNKKILNLTIDSSVPFLCGENRNVLSLPFFNESMIERTHLEKLTQIRAGVYADDELIVSNNPLAKNPQYKVTELGRVQLPESFRFMGGSHPVMVYAIQKI